MRSLRTSADLEGQPVPPSTYRARGLPISSASRHPKSVHAASLAMVTQPRASTTISASCIVVITARRRSRCSPTMAAASSKSRATFRTEPLNRIPLVVPTTTKRPKASHARAIVCRAFADAS